MLDEGDAISARALEPATGLHAAGLGPSGYRFRLPATLSLVPRWNSAAASGSGRVLPVVVPRSYRVMGARDFLAPTWRLRPQPPTRGSQPPLVARLAGVRSTTTVTSTATTTRQTATATGWSTTPSNGRARVCARSPPPSASSGVTAVAQTLHLRRVGQRCAAGRPDPQLRRRADRGSAWHRLRDALGNERSGTASSRGCRRILVRLRRGCRGHPATDSPAVRRATSAHSPPQASSATSGTGSPRGCAPAPDIASTPRADRRRQPRSRRTLTSRWP